MTILVSREVYKGVFYCLGWYLNILYGKEGRLFLFKCEWQWMNFNLLILFIYYLYLNLDATLYQTSRPYLEMHQCMFIFFPVNIIFCRLKGGLDDWYRKWTDCLGYMH